MKEIDDKLTNLAVPADHYLVKAKASSHHYYSEFLETAALLKARMTEREFEFWFTEKMALKAQVFAEKTFIQYAVESAVVRFFGERFPTNFRIEAKINGVDEKDVDCQFVDNGFTFNVEVKCSDYVSKERIDNKDAYKFGMIGRFPDRGEEAIATISNALDEGHTIKGEPLKEHVKSKNMDNNLMEFLQLAHGKFPSTTGENELNVLVVGCDDERDIQNWFYYLHLHQGLFTRESFANRATYANVDVVVFTNLYFKHNKFFDKSVSGSWSLTNTFNLIFANPFRKADKQNAIMHFINILPNFSNQLQAYKIPGVLPTDVEISMRISNFVKAELEARQSVYLFNRPS
jgi:hypothetical protein